MDAKISIWNNFKKYINSLPDGEIFYRKDLIKHLYSTKSELCILYGKYVSVDVYKRCAELNGIIDILDRSAYIKLHNIPEDMSVVDFKYRAYASPIYKGGSIMDVLNQI